jgi:hypothetical protein
MFAAAAVRVVEAVEVVVLDAVVAGEAVATRVVAVQAKKDEGTGSKSSQKRHSNWQKKTKRKTEMRYRG